MTDTRTDAGDAGTTTGGTTSKAPATKPKRVRTRHARRPAAGARSTEAAATIPAPLAGDWSPPDLVATRDFTLGSAQMTEGKPIPADLVAGLGERGVARLRRSKLVKAA